MTPAIDIQGLSKQFHKRFSNNHQSLALDDVCLTIQPGEMVALIGASGSGKSTLIRMISGLILGDKQYKSEIKVHGQIIQSTGHLAKDIRNSRSQIGLVFQQFNLVGRLNVITNVLTGLIHRVPAWRSLLQIFTREEQVLALSALDRVGILQCAEQRASTLSGGQSQRAAIARTIVQQAKVILADEPIASLDPESSRNVMELLTEMNQVDGCTVVVALHQIHIAKKYCPRTIALRKGKVVFDGPTIGLTPEVLKDLYGAQVDEILDESDTSFQKSFGNRAPISSPFSYSHHQVVH
jgi:phosphonate transport system ATP-binding protein